MSVSSPTFTISTKGYIVLRDDVDIIGFIAYGNGIQNRILDGVTSVDAGVANSANSLQLTDAGWVSATPTSPGDQNAGQALSVTKNQIAGFAMYPNPVSNGKLSISSNSSVEKLVEIYNMIGQKVYNKIVKDNETIDISGLDFDFTAGTLGYNSLQYRTRIVSDGGAPSGTNYNASVQLTDLTVFDAVGFFGNRSIPLPSLVLNTGISSFENILSGLRISNPTIQLKMVGNIGLPFSLATDMDGISKNGKLMIGQPN